MRDERRARRRQNDRRVPALDQVCTGKPSAQDKVYRQSSLAQYNTYDARQLFSDLLRRVRGGEVIVIAHAGYPVAKLVPFDDDHRPRRPGVIRAHVVVHDATPEA
jgi:prevent-host-death family protein